MHCNTAALVLKRWIEDFEEQQASKCNEGWNTIEVMVALELPLLSTCSFSPVSALKTNSFVPLMDAVQTRVPSVFTAMN